MSNCVCGRTTRKPMCDNSCSLSEEYYQERSKRLAELFKKTTEPEENVTRKNYEQN